MRVERRGSVIRSTKLANPSCGDEWLELAKLARRDRQHFDCATWLHRAREMPKEQFKEAVERELTGRETEPWEVLYFKLYQSQMPVIERAIETACLMLGSDRSRGYCLEMICADFLAGANKGVKQFAETGSKAGIQPEHANRLRRLLSALDVATCAANMNAPGYALHPLKGDLEGHWAVRHVCIRGRGRDSRRLPGLPLGAKHAFQSIPSRRSLKRLSGRDDGERGG
jgi:plasmid maintenance system killer protein